MREKVSFHFFKDIYEENLKHLFDFRRTFKGFYIYAVDGDDLNLPCSKDVLEQGYRGTRYAKNFETHYPKMYTVYRYDILNGLITDFSFSKKYQEFQASVDLVKKAESQSITIYDRLFCGYPLMREHIEKKSYFLIRAKTKGISAHRPVKKFLESGKREDVLDWFPHLKTGRDAIKVRLVKIRNPKTKELLVFATNLEVNQMSRQELEKLYRKRWEVEGVLKDLTSTLKMEQWHSQKINGILQEIYALFWLVNNVRMQLRLTENLDNYLDEKSYKRSNFKFCLNLVMENLVLILQRKWSKLRRLLKFWIKRTMERRTRRSRAYQRIVKGKQSKFPVHSKVPRRKDP